MNTDSSQAFVGLVHEVDGEVLGYFEGFVFVEAVFDDAAEQGAVDAAA